MAERGKALAHPIWEAASVKPLADTVHFPRGEAQIFLVADVLPHQTFLKKALAQIAWVPQVTAGHGKNDKDSEMWSERAKTRAREAPWHGRKDIEEK
jgi:hypothetical protein